MSEHSTVALLHCLERYQAALLDLEDRTAAVRPDLDGPASAHLESAEGVISARLELYRCLVALGWQPPPDVATTLELDQYVARLGVGAIGG